MSKKQAKFQGSEKRVSEFWLKDAMLLGSKANFAGQVISWKELARIFRKLGSQVMMMAWVEGRDFL